MLWPGLGLVLGLVSLVRICGSSGTGVEYSLFLPLTLTFGGSVAEWLACWTQARKGLGSNRNRDTVW